jgi:hypothetical protein
MEKLFLRRSARRDSERIDELVHEDYLELVPVLDGFSKEEETVCKKIVDKDGNIIDPDEPSVGTVVQLAFGPELTHKGIWGVWVIGLVMCVISAVSILFVDELFRWNLSFRVRDAYDAEPSDWEIATRYIGWTLEPIMILIIFLTGLK